jgi:hypothetical protein
MQIAGISRTTPHRSRIPLDGLQQRMVFLFPLFKPRQLFRRQQGGDLAVRVAEDQDRPCLALARWLIRPQ